ncbi:hypothetical protein DV736_g6162, partial [Chaetothyriales sp. CBS 134916]
MTTSSPSSLAIEGSHVLITGGAGGVSSTATKEFLANGCCVTVLDKRSVANETLALTPEQKEQYFYVEVDLTSESSVEAAFVASNARFGPPCILIANSGTTEDNSRRPIWELDADSKAHATNIKETLLAVKHFLLSVKRFQESTGKELANVAIVVTGSPTAVFEQEGHVDHAVSEATLLHGFVRVVQNDIVRLNSKARINAVVSSPINTLWIEDRPGDQKVMDAEHRATVASKKGAKPEEVARTLLYLASHRATGHIRGVCLDAEGGIEGRAIWKEQQGPIRVGGQGLAPPIRRRRMRICLSVDFDGLSGYLGTGHDPHNTLSDYSAGLLSANVGVGRLLRLFTKWSISDKVTWFTPCHSLETFPDAAQQIIRSRAEIGLHGYSHEGAYSMTVEQERDVLEKCIDIVTKLQDGKRPVGYRAPLYQIRETTVQLLQDHGFLYDSSMNAHDALPYFLQNPFPVDEPHVPDYSQNASTWMMPTPIPSQPLRGSAEAENALVEIPGSWYTEDMTPLGFYPYSANTQGYVSVDVVEKMWWDRFDWLWENECWIDEGPGQGFGSVFPMILHPESAGRAHIVGMIDKFIAKLVARTRVAMNSEITFETFESVARSWKDGSS